MLKPSKRHFLRYDAQTYETQGFIDLCGIPLKMHNDTTKDQRFSKEPRFWQVTAKAITQDATEKRTTFFKFVTDTKITLGELSIVDKFLNNHPDAIAAWKRGESITKFIGFDADESHRAKDYDDAKFKVEYPLIEWGRGRDNVR